MNLSPLQQYCLDAMGIVRYKLNNGTKPYFVSYTIAEEPSLESANQVLLGNIISALKWPIEQVEIFGVSPGSANTAAFTKILSDTDLICGLLFGVSTEIEPGKYPLLMLPSLSELHKEVSLKKKVWGQLKPFVISTTDKSYI